MEGQRRLVRIDSNESGNVRSVRIWDALTGKSLDNVKRITLELDTENIFIQGEMWLYPLDADGRIRLVEEGNVMRVDFTKVPILITEGTISGYVDERAADDATTTDRTDMVESGGVDSLR